MLNPGRRGLCSRGLTSACRAYQEVNMTAETSFSVVHGCRTIDNRHKLKLKAFRLDLRRNFFTMRSSQTTASLEKLCSLHFGQNSVVFKTRVG